MTLKSDTDQAPNTLDPVFDEYAAWFGLMMKRMMFPGSFDSRVALAEPESFNKWLAGAAAKALGPAVIDGVLRLRGDLHETADMLGAAKKPDRRLFGDFVDLYGEFILRLRRLEREGLGADTGTDLLTGLRSRSAMELDITRELDRFSRSDKPFCVIIARMDGFTAMKAESGEEKTGIVVKAVSGHIKHCLRSFDDAYYMGEGEFVMVLKNTDNRGGHAVVSRLRGILSREPLPSGRGPVTLSCCTAEPVPGDDVKTLLRNMRDDLRRHDSGAETVVDYHEESPLIRFVQTLKD